MSVRKLAKEICKRGIRNSFQHLIHCIDTFPLTEDYYYYYNHNIFCALRYISFLRFTFKLSNDTTSRKLLYTKGKN